jgi:hypothetical protein
MRSSRPPHSFQKFILFLLIPCLLNLSACSFLAGTHQTINITASDPRATIFVNGNEVGVGQASPLLERGRNHRIKAEINNRRSYAYLGRKISALGIVDIIGGLLFFVHFVGVFAPGFWELEPENVTLKIPAPR